MGTMSFGKFLWKSKLRIVFVALFVLTGLMVINEIRRKHTLEPPASKKALSRRPHDLLTRYITMDWPNDSRGLGNQIFCFVAVLFFAEITGREPAMVTSFGRMTRLEKIFQLNVTRLSSWYPSYEIEEVKAHAFDEESLLKVANKTETTDKLVVIKGYRQSWKYTQGIEHLIRRHLVFKNHIKRFAKDFLDKNIPQNWTKENFTRVAIHVRRTDVVTQPPENGYLTPEAPYYTRAMTYFMKEYERTQFIVLSDDAKWTRENIKQPMDEAPMSVNVTYVTHAHAHIGSINGRNNFDGHDLAIMSMCDHVIISVGSYGWWGAFLANGTTVYYEEWPRNGSNLQKHQFVREDYFPPTWIPLT